MQDTLFDLNSANSYKLYIFKNYTNLGAIYQAINWTSLVELLLEKKTMVGAPSWLPKQGYFGLMFLKHYLKLSDEKLLERFNTERSAARISLKFIEIVGKNAILSSCLTGENSSPSLAANTPLSR